MSLIDSNMKTWYVGFSKGYDMPFIHKLFTRPEWSHCYCFAQAGPYVQVLNPAWSDFEIGLRHDGNGGPLCALDFARQLTQNGHTILCITHRPEKLDFYSVWMPSCVSFVKAVLGYKTKWSCFNPERLFFHMIENGAEVIGDF